MCGNRDVRDEANVRTQVRLIYTDARMDPQPLRSPANVADYGYDAPYALVIFAVVGAAGTIGAIVAWRAAIAISRP